MHLNLVYLDLRSWRLYFHTEGQAPISNACTCERDGFFNHLRQVLRTHLDITLLHEITYPLHYPAHSVRLVRYALEYGLNPLLISGLDKAATGTHVIAYRGEWLIDFVDERGHYLSEFTQALNVGKLCLQLLYSLVTDVPASQIPQIVDTPVTLPLASLMGEAVTDTLMIWPSLRRRTVS